jgi:hypothetical protein
LSLSLLRVHASFFTSSSCGSVRSFSARRSQCRTRGIPPRLPTVSKALGLYDVDAVASPSLALRLTRTAMCGSSVGLFGLVGSGKAGVVAELGSRGPERVMVHAGLCLVRVDNASLVARCVQVRADSAADVVMNGCRGGRQASDPFPFAALATGPCRDGYSCRRSRSPVPLWGPN